MKKQILYIALSSVFGIGLAAAAPVPQDQSAPPAERRHAANPDEQAQHMAKRLKLSDDQLSQIKPILVETQSKMQAVREDSSVSREDRMAKMKSIHEDASAKIKAILNDDQKAEFDKMQAEQRGRMRQHTQESGAPNQ